MELSITIPAKAGNRDGVYPCTCHGEVFACISATAEFEVKPNYGDRRSARKGSTWGNPGAREFTSLVFFNTTASDIDLKFFAGKADNRPNTPLSDGHIIVVTDPAESTIVAPTEGIYVLTGAGVEAITVDATLYFQTLRLFPAKAVAAGILTANTGGDIYVGRSATYLPDKRAIADVDYPVVLDCPPGQKMALNRIRAKGTAGDGWFYSFV